MTAIVNFDLLLDRLVDFTESFIWSQGPSQQTVQPINLAGFTAALMVRVADPDITPLISISTVPNSSGQIGFSIPTGGTVLNEIDVTITKAALSATGITAGLAAFYDLILTRVDGTTLKFATGNVRVAPTYVH